MSMEKKITRQMVNDNRHQGYNVYGIFKSYCDLHSSCDECNSRVRFLCKIKSHIEHIQKRIVDKICE